MPVRHTWNAKRKVFMNEEIDLLAEKHCYEICSWPMHYPDQLCMYLLRTNPDYGVVTYIALMKGITPIVTIGDHKSFIADFSPPEKSKKRLPKFLIPSYNNIEKEEKHLRDRRC